MGLPSGNRWAVSNLDANGPYFFQETPFQYECSFFSWGNVEPHNPISNTEFDYNFGGVNSTAPYYEGQPYGDTPGSKLTGNIPLDLDAARQFLGKPWRMPSMIDFQELIENVIFIDANGNEVKTTNIDKRVTVNGTMGIYLKSKINGKRLFFPCSGYSQDINLVLRAVRGRYWSTNANSDRNAGVLYFFSAEVSTSSFLAKNTGCTVRPIWNPRELHG